MGVTVAVGGAVGGPEGIVGVSTGPVGVVVGVGQTGASGPVAPGVGTRASTHVLPPPDTTQHPPFRTHGESSKPPRLLQLYTEQPEP